MQWSCSTIDDVGTTHLKTTVLSYMSPCCCTQRARELMIQMNRVEVLDLTAANSRITPYADDESASWHLLIPTEISQSASGCQQI